MQLAGELTKISLASLIQLLRNGELTGKICVTQGANTAFIYVDRGRISHAETDVLQGREALLELFLWLTGTFSFIEADISEVPWSLPVEEPIEKLIREGLSYLEQKRYLDQLRINSRTILQATGKTPENNNPLLPALDGKTTVGQINAALRLPRRMLVQCLHHLLLNGLASVCEQAPEPDQVVLPEWVLSRLRQDNPDVSQAIVEMIIWVDRVKCWMYQADADLDRIIGQLKEGQTSEQSQQNSGNGNGKYSGGKTEEEIAMQPTEALVAPPPPSVEF